MQSLRRIPGKTNGGLLFRDLLETASFILRHPLNDTAGNKAGTFRRYLSWHIRSRLRPDPSLIDFTFRDGDRFVLDGMDLEVVHTPGHSAG